MKKADSLRRRIIAAYMTFAIAVSAVFAIIAALAVEGIEDRLVDERLMEVAEWAAPRHSGGMPVQMPAGLTFHHGADIPRSLRGLPHGVVDVKVDGTVLHVFAGSDGKGEFVVVDHDSEYDKIEIVVYSMFAAGFMAFVACSLVLARFLANRIVTPITLLSQAVEDRHDSLPCLDRNDELGTLARAFAGRTGELKQFLDRERFFTGDVSHELRTPLTVISGAAELLMASTEGEPALQAPAERIYRAAREASDVASVLLRLARSPQGLDAPEQSVAELAEYEAARSQALVAGKAVALRYQGGHDFKVRGSRELLQAVIGNLLRNACAYTEQGEVLLRLEQHSIVVEDTGPGLPPAAMARLRGESMPDGDGISSGSGLGLGLVQRICIYLGAELLVRHREGGGTRFDISFPA
ncbi:sensor histidine kinase [Pseudoduganella violaceinigra]|uniref:sensor histidine kinase n=1 Tax=Pseudoduganella violaceinigra TaxID=246602 RepID=UPI0004081034|nr:HAMP domain-containing sensor histidine kinase [Pseudoduganella violaceinigra]